MENETLSAGPNRAQQEEHKQEILAAVKAVIEDFGSNNEAVVVQSFEGTYRRLASESWGWEPAQTHLQKVHPSLVLRERFRSLPFWALSRLVLCEYESAYVPKHMRSSPGFNRLDDPVSLAELDTATEWLDADATSHPEIGRYAVLEETELKALLWQPHLALPYTLKPAAYDRGWLGGRTWKISESWSEEWLTKLTQGGRLAHFYCWLKLRHEGNPRFKER